MASVVVVTAVAVSAVAVVVIEAIVLTLMRWGRFWRSLRASLAMNAVTTVIGFFLVGALLGLPPALWVAAAFSAVNPRVFWK